MVSRDAYWGTRAIKKEKKNDSILKRSLIYMNYIKLSTPGLYCIIIVVYQDIIIMNKFRE